MADSWWKRLAAACATCVLAVACVGGCVRHEAVAADCSWIDEPVGGQGGEVTSNAIALVDLSASFWPTAGKSVSATVDPVKEIERHLTADFGKDGTRLVTLAGFDGSSASLNQRLVAAPLPAPAGSSVESDRARAAQCLRKEINGLLKQRPQTPGSDPLAALASAGSQRDGTPASRTRVLVVTDGLGNTGCMDLRRVFKEGLAPAELIKSCPERKDLAGLEGVSVRLAGIGLQARRTALTSAQHAWLRNYWSDLCGALKAEGDCLQRTSGSVVRRSAVQRPDDPVIAFPDFSGTRVELPEALLFASDSAKLSTTAKSYLNLLIAQLDGRRIVSVVGHTDGRGGRAYNADLSRRRAEAVNTYLTRAGFGGGKPSGVGATEPKCEHEYVDGKPDRACMAQNRRVEITLGG